MSLFTVNKMTVTANKISKVPGSKQVIPIQEVVAENIKCRLTGTDHDNIKIFVLKENYNKIPGGIHKNFIISVDGMFQSYTVSKEPIWAGGVKHHIEISLEESK